MDLDEISALNLFSCLPALSPVDPRKKELIEKLPALSEDDLTSMDQKDSCCPICFTPFLAILASEEMALAMESPALSVEHLGVTRLAETCGHLFCRKDIAKWIREHDTCPTCRQPFFTTPRSFADDGTTQDARIDSEEGYVLQRLSGSGLDEEWVLFRAAVESARQRSTGTMPSPEDETRRNQDEACEEFVGMYS